MAKKVTITGENLLKALADAWGGVNNSSSSQNIHGTNVPAGAEWGMNRGEVERFLKEQLKGRCGTARWLQEGNFFYLDGFAQESDITLYDSDPVTYEALRLFHKQLPISATQVDSYIARLYTDRGGSTQYVVKDGDAFEVGIRFSALHIIAATSEQENLNRAGTLIIERSIDGQQTWTQVGTATLPSSDHDATDYPTTLNLGDYLLAGRSNTIRLRATCSYTSSTGESAVMTSGSVLVNVASVTLAGRLLTDPTRPIMASGNAFPLSVMVTGAVEKWLHVTISGSLGTYTYVERIATGTEYPETSPKTWSEAEKSSIGILTHGVHTVRVWVTCDDGSGHTDSSGYPDGITSEVDYHQFMVVNTNASAEELSKPRIMLQNVNTSVSNYVRAIIADYTVWVPDSTDPTVASDEPLPVSIRITDYGETDTEYTRVYAQEEHTGAGGLRTGTTYRIDTAVEIEDAGGSTRPDEYLAYLRIFRYVDGSPVNFLYESMGQRAIALTVDNREDFAPTPGAWFVLNPRNRNNGEEGWQTIINAQNGEVVPSEGWEGMSGVNDAWVTAEDGQKVFRVLAGQRFVIILDPWKDFNGTDINSIQSQMSMLFDFATRNITKEDEPIVTIIQESGGETLGLKIYPLEGHLLAKGKQSVQDQDFGFEEGKRTRLGISTTPALTTRASDELTWMIPTDGATSKPLPVARIYLDGYPERDIDYEVEAGAWGSGAGKKIVIGCDYADIDIYGMRLYNFALSPAQMNQDVKASLPTAEEKIAFKEKNDITTNDRIDYEKAKAKGFRCLTWVGIDQYKTNQDKNTGYAGYWRIDHDNPSFSGTIGKASYLASMANALGGKKCLMITNQGSTAGTYWENNGQTKVDKITFVVNIPFSKVHADFGWNASMSTGEDCSNPMYLNGTRIEGTDYASLSDAQKSQVTIDVVDGWFDGNGWSENVNEMGMYHGQFYTCYEGGPKCTKLVNKINYASPMQSHKMGATRMFNDVMKAVLGGGMQLHKDNPEARFAVYEESFLYFTENPTNGYKTEFHGMCTFGQGKFDKASFGYAKDKRTFAFEGLNNNLPLCDFRVPADDDVVYDPDEESWSYNGVKSMEYGLGKTKVVGTGDDAKEYPTDDNDAMFRKYACFIYSHNTTLRYYNGTRAQFEAHYNSLLADADTKSEAEEMQLYQYWFTQGLTQVRYDYVRSQWVDAGTWDQDNAVYSAGQRKLDEYYMTSEAYRLWQAGGSGDYSELNRAFRFAYANHFSSYFGTVGSVRSHLTHYNLVNFMMAGTDNCSKNTYYQYDPDTGTIFFDGDDLDSILPNDNNGRQTKKYFLDRMHDVADYLAGYKPQIDYEGRASALFNTIECAYEENGSTALRQNMREVLTALSSLVGSSDGYSQSVMGCFDKYFFSTQEYFPQVAYQEQARIRYEYPKSFGYISHGTQARGIDPITQQVGSQLFRERQYMKRRLAYIASYACWGGFSGGVNSGVIGLSDADQQLSLQPGQGKSGSDYTFTVVPHQWLYPSGTDSGRSAVDPHVRVAPGEEFTFSVGGASGDGAVGLNALNYFRKIGNLGNMTVTNVLNVSAQRLVEFIAEPTNPANSQFAPSSLNLNTPNLRKLSLRGTQSIGGSRNLSGLRRVEEIDLRDTSITLVTIPQTSTLVSLQLPASLTSLTLTAQPSLSTLTLQGYDSLSSLTITGSPLLGGEASRVIAISMMESAANVTNINLKDIDWNSQPVNGDFVRWLIGVGDGGTCLLEGSMTVSSANYGALYYADVVALIARYGDIRSAANPLYIVFGGSSIGASSMSISGKKYINSNPESSSYDLDGSEDYHGLGLLVAAGNDVAVATKADGSTVADVTWEFVESNASTYAEFPDKYSPVVRFKQTGAQLENVKLTVLVTLTNTSGETRQVSKTIGLWNRVPEVGDFAWAEGEFDNENDTSKTLVGIVIRKVDNGDGTYELDVLGTKGLQLASYTSANFASTWGPCSDNNQTNGFLNTKTGTSYNDTIIEAIRVAVQTWKKPEGVDYATENGYITDVFNTPLRNITGNHTISAANYQDASKTDGYADQSSYPYNEDFLMEEENAVLMSYADTILKAVIAKLNITQDEYMAIGCSSDGIPQTMAAVDALANLIVGRANVTKPERYRQLLFPAVRMCNVWSPQDEGVADGDLHDNYKRGHWRLMPSGLMARYFNFVGNSRTNYGSGAIVESKASDDITQEAMLPLFANAIKRGRTIPVSTGSYHWCSAEYNSSSARFVVFGSGNAYGNSKYSQSAVRPAVAFTFTK